MATDADDDDDDDDDGDDELRNGKASWCQEMQAVADPHVVWGLRRYHL